MNWFKKFRKASTKPTLGTEGIVETSMMNFTPRAQQVLALARTEADRLNHNFLGTEHLLLGLIKLGQGVAVNVLAKFGLDLETVRKEVEQQVGKGPNQKMIGNIPYTPRVKKVLALASKEAKALNHTYVGTEHILLGLLREGDGVAPKVLKNLGVNPEETRREILRELDPNFLPARFELAQIYLMARLPDRALDALQEPLSNPEKFSPGETDETQLHVLAAAAYFQKNETASGAKLLETEIVRHPDDTNLLSATMQVFITRGLFTNALAVIDSKLKSAPDDLNWLYSRGYVEIQLKKYGAAVADLSRVLDVQSNNYNALFNRAVANLESGKLDAARLDYEKLQQTFSNSVPVAYGLGEIAYRQHDTSAAIRNYAIYLAGANTNTDEAKTVAERLRELKK